MWLFAHFRPFSTLENHMWRFALFSVHFPLWKIVCGDLLLLVHFPLWKTICGALPSVQATFHFGKPYVTLCPLFRTLSTSESHVWRFALCSGHFPLWKTICDAVLCVQVTFHFGKPYVTLCPLFRPLSILENHLWLLVMASSVMMCPQDLYTCPTLFLEKVSVLKPTDQHVLWSEPCIHVSWRSKKNYQTDKVLWSSRGDPHKGNPFAFVTDLWVVTAN